MPSPITETTAKVHGLLEPLTSEERRRVVQAALTLLGDNDLPRTPLAANGKADSVEDEHGDTAKLTTKAKAWIEKHGLTRDRLENFFHFDNEKVTCIELAGDGKSKRENTINTYLLLGVAALLGKGEPEFNDDEARKLCSYFGCFDSPNHAKYIKEFGNVITGNKSSGWKLTAPGLATAADHIKSS